MFGAACACLPIRWLSSVTPFTTSLCGPARLVSIQQVVRRKGGAVNHRVLSAEPLDKRKGGRDIKKSSSSTEQHAHSPLYVIFAPTLSAATPQFSPLYGVYISFLLSFLSLYCTYPTIPSLSLQIDKSYPFKFGEEKGGRRREVVKPRTDLRDEDGPRLSGRIGL